MRKYLVYDVGCLHCETAVSRVVGIFNTEAEALQARRDAEVEAFKGVIVLGGQAYSSVLNGFHQFNIHEITV